MRLTDADLLAELDRPECAAVRRAFVTRRYPRGRQVFAPRETENRLFIVARGRARVYLASKGKEFTMAILDVGDVYTTHTRAHVEALDDLDLLEADIAAVRRFLADMPALTISMVKVLGDLLSHAFTVIDGLAFHDVRRRLAQLLLLEARRAQPDATGAACFDHGLSIEQLATIVGSSRQTVSSLLNALEREGVIRLKGRGVICVPDPDALEALLDV
ncbi:Crp/Fnr family transcriptional regulator [Solidesulfovibrio sp.]|uniref:Crp/Fnr family transcriptional regulator n=1 Tax=Solidesulfovibrio sp. TaxID=2910990 RepID=UPI002B203AFF|nr:Crp/Fnr family transcriptional regulator [Solidesulfovibrio sp.]MEA5090681.1 Crp/Fnr family transcriptional regulator [Solidesulfovibrio sp.]HML61088.1 Crp/Fnr family transcriptional regulator [Solidesulfovibrio sp.]